MLWQKLISVVSVGQCQRRRAERIFRWTHMVLTFCSLKMSRFPWRVHNLYKECAEQNKISKWLNIQRWKQINSNWTVKLVNHIAYATAIFWFGFPASEIRNSVRKWSCLQCDEGINRKSNQDWSHRHIRMLFTPFPDIYTYERCNFSQDFGIVRVAEKNWSIFEQITFRKDYHSLQMGKTPLDLFFGRKLKWNLAH